MGTIISLIGKRFGKLFVVDKSKKRTKRGEEKFFGEFKRPEEFK